jgi:MFS family permease
MSHPNHLVFSCQLTALMLTLLLEALDQTVVGTALPRIIGSLQGFDRYTWAVTAYTIASVTMVPIFGKLSDQFGRKWFLVVGTTIFLVGSVLAGASQTMNQLIAFDESAGSDHLHGDCGQLLGKCLTRLLAGG